MKQYALIIFSVLMFFSCKHGTEYRTGDLIFQDLDCGAMCNAIEGVEKGYGGMNISHVGIIDVEDSGIFVIEAYDGVQMTPLKKFLARSSDKNGNPKILLMRLKAPYTKFIPAAIDRAKKLLGSPYDDEFRLNNGKYYCSELVYEVFLNKDGKHIFGIKPMTFKDDKTGKTDSVWIKHFALLNEPVPEGEPGCNPADYSKSDKLYQIPIQIK